MGFSAVVRDIALSWGPHLGGFAARWLHRPLFVIGFNKSGKSTLVEGLAQQPDIAVFPGEGNAELWFRGLYPWPQRRLDAPPLWCDPARFVRAVLDSRPDAFRETRAQLGSYSALRAPRRTLLHDNGMLAALLPELMPAFPDARFVHVVRDGRVTAFLAAHKTIAAIAAQPAAYGNATFATDYDAVLAAQADYWCWTLDRVAAAAQTRPAAFLTIRYEDWCADPTATLTAIADFAGLRRFRAPQWAAPIANHNDAVLRTIPAADLAVLGTRQSDHLRSYGYAAASAASHAGSAW